ncbi:MAG: hypothetical protein ACK2U9_14635, partial [Anaerolineae bacterium]
MRYNGLRWADVEATRGTYDWEKVADLETQLQAAYEAGLQTILIVRRTPEWAQKVPGSFCSAPRPEALQDLADVQLERRMVDLFVTRIRELEPDERAEISASIQKSDGEIVIRSAFELPAQAQQTITDAVQEHLLN